MSKNRKTLTISRPAEFMQLLQAVVKETKHYKYETWIENKTPGKKYYGEISDSSFSIVPLVSGRNYFTPILRGEMKNCAEGMELRVKACNSPLVMAEWPLLLFSLFFIVRMFIDFSPAYIRFAVVPLVLVGVGLLISRSAKKKALEGFLKIAEMYSEKT